MPKLTMKPVELRVLRPLLFFFRSAAFFSSALVREIAPMDSSLEKRAALTFLMIVYHAVGGERNDHTHREVRLEGVIKL